ncbi:MAG TPA: phosphatidylserine decarboxylase [Calidithermus sp.]|nr:phosphatidylserine decarboxylase [Calidithermus sp.]
MRVPVAREGWPYILAPAALAAGLWVAGHRRLAGPFAAAALASLGFFRDPDRESPADPRAVLAPADGRVTEVAEDRDDWVGPAVRVSIFLSPLDVHVNRSPIAGRVAATAYTPGAFVAAYRTEAGRVNERCAVHLEGDGGVRVSVVQVAGVLARRIVCRVGQGDKLQAGERFGMIRFGSRTDCLMPRGTEIRVRQGDRVRGGVSILGVLP